MISNETLQKFSEDGVASAIVDQVQAELVRAEGKHKPMNSLHEAYAVILEELDEFWDEVKKKKEERDLEKIRTELIQTAAMCCRAIKNLLPV